MKLYVAGKFEERARVSQFIHAARIEGHTITHDWTHETSEGLTGNERRTYLRSCAEDDRRGAQACEVLVVFHHPRGRGLFVELGLALAARKPVILVGWEDTEEDISPCIFYYLHEVIFVKSERGALDALKARQLAKGLFTTPGERA